MDDLVLVENDECVQNVSHDKCDLEFVENFVTDVDDVAERAELTKFHENCHVSFKNDGSIIVDCVFAANLTHEINLSSKSVSAFGREEAWKHAFCGEEGA